VAMTRSVPLKYAVGLCQRKAAHKWTLATIDKETWVCCIIYH
jgi:hypothetical protein